LSFYEPTVWHGDFSDAMQVAMTEDASCQSARSVMIGWIEIGRPFNAAYEYEKSENR